MKSAVILDVNSVNQPAWNVKLANVDNQKIKLVFWSLERQTLNCVVDSDFKYLFI